MLPPRRSGQGHHDLVDVMVSYTTSVRLRPATPAAPPGTVISLSLGLAKKPTTSIRSDCCKDLGHRPCALACPANQHALRFVIAWWQGLDRQFTPDHDQRHAMANMARWTRGCSPRRSATARPARKRRRTTPPTPAVSYHTFGRRCGCTAGDQGAIDSAKASATTPPMNTPSATTLRPRHWALQP